jgi:demethylmacrocin O-methyltransferase
MTSLDELAIAFNTDKSSRTHNFTKHYEVYFENLRNAPLKLLEIGVQSGASLRMWKHYFPKAEIYGLDYYPLEVMEEERIKIFKGMQGNIELLEKVLLDGPFDIIIDDGSHQNKDIMTSFEYLFPRMKPGGIYVIEDTTCTYWGDTHNVGPNTTMDKMKQLVDDVNGGGKTGIGDIRKDPADPMFKQKGLGKMTWYERNVSFVHFYRSIVFICRYEQIT